MSSFSIPSIASMTLFAFSRSWSPSISPRAAGTICQDKPNLSWSQRAVARADAVAVLSTASLSPAPGRVNARAGRARQGASALDAADAGALDAPSAAC
jgi:hypothetical protein